ncbi:MAG: hypothetical protein WBU92_08140, partial [Candidatus Dormiibacterota bacterium]
GVGTRGGANRWRLVSAALAFAGLFGVGLGVVAALTAAPVSAAGFTVCGQTVSLAPGDSGTCMDTVTWSGATSYSGPVNVALDVSTQANSAGSALGPGVGTEAVLDGTATGLQVTVTDSAGSTYSIGTVSCFGSAPPSASASPPHAAYCQSSDQNQQVATSQPKGYSDTFSVHWLLPLAAGNQYQGGGATVTLGAVLTGTASGAVFGASTQQGGASTPGTGAQLPAYLSWALVLVGLVAILVGFWLWRRESGRLAR